MSPLSRTVLLAILGFAVAGTLAFAAGRAIHRDEIPPAALPEFEAVEPLLIPIPVMDDEDIADAAVEYSEQDLAARELTSELAVELDSGGHGSFGSAGVGGTRVGGDPEPPDPGTPGGTAGDPEPSDAAEEGDPIPTEPRYAPPSPISPAIESAIDECAEGAEGCPLGVGGTILLAIRDLPPLSGFAVWEPAETGHFVWEPTCPAIDIPAGAAYIGFTTSRPVDITMRYRAGRWNAGTYEVEGTFEHTTPDTAEAPWRAWLEDETAPANDPRAWITHCVLIVDLPIRSDYIAFINYRDKHDPTISANDPQVPFRFAVRDARGLVPGEQRRRTFLLGVGIDELLIGVTRAPEQRFHAIALQDAAPGSCDTGGDEASVIFEPGANLSRVVSDELIPEDELMDPAYPYLPEHTVDVVHRLWLEEGSDYLICLYWLAPGASFDPTVVVISEEASVSTPEAYRPRFTLHGATDLFGSIDSMSLTLFPCGFFQMELSSFRAGEAQMLDTPLELCRADSQLTLLDRLIRFHTTVFDTFEERSVSGGAAVRTNLECTVAPCLLRLDEMIRVPLPEVVAERRLCGSGFGGGCSGEVPRRVAGYAIVGIEYVTTPGNERTTWSIGRAEEFEDTPLPPRGDAPLLDVRVEYELVGGAADGADAEVRVTADRPVTLSAMVAEATDCGLGAPGSYARDELAEVHVFSIGPLCLGDEYTLEVTAFGETGAQATIILGGDDIGPALPLVVPPLLVEMDTVVTIPAPGDALRWHTALVPPVGVAVPSTVVLGYAAHLPWEWPIEDRNAAALHGWDLWGLEGRASACGEPGAGPLTVHSRHRAALLSQTDITFTLVVDVLKNPPRGGVVVSDCARGDVETSHVMQATVTLEELFAGITITSEHGASVSIRVVDWRRGLVGGGA